MSEAYSVLEKRQRAAQRKRVAPIVPAEPRLSKRERRAPAKLEASSSGEGLMPSKPKKPAAARTPKGVLGSTRPWSHCLQTPARFK